MNLFRLLDDILFLRYRFWGTLFLVFVAFPAITAIWYVRQHMRDIAKPVTIAQARKTSEGYAVQVEGVVTVTAGTFDAGFALQDTGDGIYVSDSVAGIKPVQGDRLRVTGHILSRHRETMIAPSAIVKLGHAFIPATPLPHTGSLNEIMEGRLLSVRGRVQSVAQDGKWGWKLMLDDGSGPLLVFVDRNVSVNIWTLHPGDTLNVTGFAGRYEDHVELLPRSATDIQKLPPKRF